MRDRRGKPTIRDSKGRARKLKKRPVDVNKLEYFLGEQYATNAKSPASAPEPQRYPISK